MAGTQTTTKALSKSEHRTVYGRVQRMTPDGEWLTCARRGREPCVDHNELTEYLKQAGLIGEWVRVDMSPGRLVFEMVPEPPLTPADIQPALLPMEDQPGGKQRPEPTNNRDSQGRPVKRKP